MKNNMKSAASVFGRVVFANVICIFVCMVVSVICVALFTRVIGYNAYGTKVSDSSDMSAGGLKAEMLYEYRYDEGEDTKKAEYEAQGYTVSTEKVRSEMSEGARAAFLIINQIFCLVVLIQFVYGEVWHTGTTDNNKVHFGRITYDKYRGIKIGALAMLPFLLLFIGLAVLKIFCPGFPLIVYKLLNSSVFSIIDIIFGSASKLSQLSVVRMVLSLSAFAVVPLISHIAYTLGFKQFSISEKLIYKKKKDK